MYGKFYGPERYKDSVDTNKTVITRDFIYETGQSGNMPGGYTIYRKKILYYQDESGTLERIETQKTTETTTTVTQIFKNKDGKETKKLVEKTIDGERIEITVETTYSGG